MPRVRVTATILLWIPGAVLFGVGWILDDNGWTAAHGFSSNILAAATSGFLGLPIAAIVVQWLLRQDAESRRRREIIESARRNFGEMGSSLEELGIEKVRRLQQPVSVAAMDIVGLHFAVNFTGGQPPAQLIREVHASFSALTPVISENLPSNAEDEWRFSSVLRRWEVLKETVFSPGEVDGIRVIPDHAYATLSANIEIIATERVEWLPDLLRDADTLVAALGEPPGDEAVRIDARLIPFIGELNVTLSSLRKQVVARVELHTELVAARKLAENMTID